MPELAVLGEGVCAETEADDDADGEESGDHAEGGVALAEEVGRDGDEEGTEHGVDEEFFLLVQWHPERMDANNPFSGKLRDAFLNACKEYNQYSDLNQSLSVTP